ncbi:MAG: sigma-70 family RNA polymerase sigma factor [Acidobacteria bacterium]|nr:sigma-70 family RNA polymerase sigma factor [Acidobacteriota bacterium]
MMSAVAIAIAPTSGPLRPTAAKDQDALLMELIRGTARGDQQAFARFYDLTNRLVFSLVLRVLGDFASAEEVTLDVFMQVWQQATHYTPERGKPLAWITMMARSRAIDRLRSARHTKKETEPLDTVSSFHAETDTPEDASLFSEQRQKIRAALNTLTREQREVLEIAYFGGLTQTEIAERLRLPLGTVKTRMRSGLLKLRQALQKL